MLMYIHLKLSFLQPKYFIFIFTSLSRLFHSYGDEPISRGGGGETGVQVTPGKPPDSPASRTWLVSHLTCTGLEPTSDTWVR